MYTCGQALEVLQKFRQAADTKDKKGLEHLKEDLELMIDIVNLSTGLKKAYTQVIPFVKEMTNIITVTIEQLKAETN